MIVTIECRINVGGVWWDISIEKSIDEDLPPEAKIETLEKLIKGLSRSKIISRVDPSPPPVQGKGEFLSPFPPSSDAGMAAFMWPPPFCDVHREAMMVSKVQKKPGYVQYYCPKEFGEGYCKKRASVLEQSGIPEFWEVK